MTISESINEYLKKYNLDKTFTVERLKKIGVLLAIKVVFKPMTKFVIKKLDLLEDKVVEEFESLPVAEQVKGVFTGTYNLLTSDKRVQTFIGVYALAAITTYYVVYEPEKLDRLLGKDNYFAKKNNKKYAELTEEEKKMIEVIGLDMSKDLMNSEDMHKELNDEYNKLMKKLEDDVNSTAKDIVKDASNKASEAYNNMEDKISDVESVISDTLEDIGDKLRDAREDLADKIDDVRDGISDVVDDVKKQF